MDLSTKLWLEEEYSMRQRFYFPIFLTLFAIYIIVNGFPIGWPVFAFILAIVDWWITPIYIADD